MSFEDQVITTYEDRLVFLDKSGSGAVQYLVLSGADVGSRRSSHGGGTGGTDSGSNGGGGRGSGGGSSSSSGGGVVVAGSGTSSGDSVGADDDDEDEVENDEGVREATSAEEIRNFRLRWLDLSSLLRNVHEFAACEMNNRLYVTGGFHVTDIQYRSRTLEFNPEQNKWRDLRPMKKARAKHAVAVYKGRLVVAGGETAGGKITRSCEAYDAERDEWSDFARLPAHRCWMACAVFRGELYASGGSCGGRGHDDLWIYEEKSKVWSHLDRHFPLRLPNDVDRHLMVALGDTLYFFGGVEYPKESAEARDGQRAQTRALTDGYRPPRMSESSGESAPQQLTHRQQQLLLLEGVTPWVYGLPDMWHARHSAAHIVLDGKLYLFGGTNNDYKSAVQATDLFNPRTATWSEEGTLRGESIGNPVCVRLMFSETRVIKRALPRSWPLW